ncbi:MAG: ATP synthase F0 subunit B [Candidatus Acidiferrales bacterium]
MTRTLYSLERRICYAAMFIFLAAVPVFAQEGGSSPAESPTGDLFHWLNFLIVFGVIVYLAVKVGGPAFRKRAEGISVAIAEGTRAREAAEEQRREVQAKLANLEKEVVELRVQAKRDAEAEAQRLRALARTEAEKIERAAQAEIVAAERAARLELKVAAARIAIERAEALLREELTPKAEAGLFEMFVAELERSVN